MKILMTSFFSLAIAVAGSNNAWASAQDFNLENQTGKAIHKVFVSESASNDWEEDILGKDVLMSDDSVDIEFSPDSEANLYDLKAVTGDGDEYIWGKLNLFQIIKVTIKLQNGKPVALTEDVE